MRHARPAPMVRTMATSASSDRSSDAVSQASTRENVSCSTATAMSKRRRSNWLASAPPIRRRKGGPEPGQKVRMSMKVAEPVSSDVPAPRTAFCIQEPMFGSKAPKVQATEVAVLQRVCRDEVNLIGMDEGFLGVLDRCAARRHIGEAGTPSQRGWVVRTVKDPVDLKRRRWLKLAFQWSEDGGQLRGGLAERLGHDTGWVTLPSNVLTPSARAGRPGGGLDSLGWRAPGGTAGWRWSARRSRCSAPPRGCCPPRSGGRRAPRTRGRRGWSRGWSPSPALVDGHVDDDRTRLHALDHPVADDRRRPAAGRRALRRSRGRPWPPPVRRSPGSRPAS